MQENVLGFDVSVNHIIIMHKLNCMANLSHHTFSSFFSKTALFLECGIGIASTARFQYQVQKFLITEKSIELNYVRMVKKTLNFDLADQLVHKFGLTLEDLLRDALQRHHHLRILVPEL